MDTKILPELQGKVIAEAKVYLGGAYMESDDRSVQMTFTDGTQFIFEVLTKPKQLQGSATLWPVKSDKRKLLTRL